MPDLRLAEPGVGPRVPELVDRPRDDRLCSPPAAHRTCFPRHRASVLICPYRPLSPGVVLALCIGGMYRPPKVADRVVEHEFMHELHQNRPATTGKPSPETGLRAWHRTTGDACMEGKRESRRAATRAARRADR